MSSEPREEEVRSSGSSSSLQYFTTSAGAWDILEKRAANGAWLYHGTSAFSFSAAVNGTSDQGTLQVSGAEHKAKVTATMKDVSLGEGSGAQGEGGWWDVRLRRAGLL